MPPATVPSACFTGGGRVAFRDRQVPTPGDGELLVQVRANAICSSDRRQFDEGSHITPGHEIAGAVAVAGPLTTTAPGTLGVVYLMDYCGACRRCAAGATNQCLDKRADVGFDRDGGYGPFVLVSESAFFAVDPSLDPSEATLLLDVMGTSRHAIERGRLVVPDIEHLVVVGAGPVGLGVLVMARLILGADVPVLVSDLLPYRLELVERLGGIPVDGRWDSLTTALEQRGLPRADLAIDASGSSAARAAALTAVARSGALVCVGHGGSLALDVSSQLIAPERAVLGSEYFPYAMLEDNHRLLLEHRDLVSEIITHRAPVAELEPAMQRFFAGDTGKVVVEQTAA